MKIYQCKLRYLSGLMDEPAPHWPRDYDLAGEMDQVGTGKEALEAAFSQSAGAMKPGDVVGLDDGTLWRCEVEGWSDIGKSWVARVHKGQERVKQTLNDRTLLFANYNTLLPLAAGSRAFSPLLQ